MKFEKSCAACLFSFLDVLINKWERRGGSNYGASRILDDAQNYSILLLLQEEEQARIPFVYTSSYHQRVRRMMGVMLLAGQVRWTRTECGCYCIA